MNIPVRCCLLDAAYVGEHTDLCSLRTHIAPVPDTRQYEPCDCCAHRFYSTHSVERQPFDPGPRTPIAMHVKEIGKPCPVCGDDSPKGTWPWIGPVWVRIDNDTWGPQYVGQYGEVDRARLFATLSRKAA